MIDSSDGDTFWVLSLFTKNPWVTLILLVLAGVFWVVAASNEKECQAKTCPPGMSARLIDHECLCAIPASD